jgi:Ser/Thr protein kinase RdoA (MazF antagonist)|nr:phosphotransferase [uncultured Lachnoclostridium sp.]
MLKIIQDKLSDNILCEFGKRYGAIEGSLKPCGGNEAAVYSFQKSNDEYIMKITHNTIKDKIEVAGEIEFVNYLYDNGAKVSNVINSHKGNLIEIIDDDDGYLYARCYSKARGYRITDQWSTSLFTKWGQTMGKLHKLSKQFQPSQYFYCPHWNKNKRLNNFLWKQEAIIDSVNEVTNYLQSLPRSNDNYGVVHNDFHQDNFLIDDNQLTVFDFDDMGYSWYINDISIVLYYSIYQNAFMKQEKDFMRRFFNSFMEGYSKENYIERDWFSQIPYFLRLRHIILYSAYCQLVDFDNLEKYEERLLLKFRRDIHNKRELIDISHLL